MLKKVVALDFDGVICDSAKECMFVSYMAYVKSSDNHIKINTKLRESFLNHRYLVRDPKNFYLLWKVIIEGSISQYAGKQDLFEERAKNEKDENFNSFRERYFQTRKKLKVTNIKTWLRKNPLYPNVEAVINKLLVDYPVYIITTKDIESVQDILYFHGITPTKIYDGSTFTQKGMIINQLQAQHSKEGKKCVIYYVDDQFSDLQSCQSAGAVVRWATWGYGLKPESITALESFAEIPHFVHSV
ncbi:MAG: HAD family hydrolase [Oligoflexia bacterium]|nr:HAD family hydrolase [Oligoflexia bacterium]